MAGKRWALIRRLVPVMKDDEGKPVDVAVNEQLRARVDEEQDEVRRRLVAVETRVLRRS